ncbi:MAG: YceI family protein [Sulfurimonas sp.]|jgi:polyisoprenoid-binding protein YceI|nr:YceI family protein [Sulfurimonas sp.]
MIKKYLLGALFTSSALFAQCNFDSQDIKVGWTAFKTYEKIGVGGSFDKVALSSSSASSLAKTLEGTSVEIDTSSVNTNHAERDATLVKSFFEVQNTSSIKAKILKVSEKSLDVAIEMNGVTRTIPFKYTKSEGKVEAHGVIDLGDFHMLLALGAINKACYDLHAGKTWQDVSLSFTLQLDKECR